MEEGIRTSKRRSIKRRAFSPEAEPPAAKRVAVARKPRRKSVKLENPSSPSDSTPCLTPVFNGASSSVFSDVVETFEFNPTPDITPVHDVTPVPETAAVHAPSPVPSTSAVYVAVDDDMEDCYVDEDFDQSTDDISLVSDDELFEDDECPGSPEICEPVHRYDDIAILKRLHPLLAMSTIPLEDRYEKEFFARAVLLPVSTQEVQTEDVPDDSVDPNTSLLPSAIVADEKLEAAVDAVEAQEIDAVEVVDDSEGMDFEETPKEVDSTVVGQDAEMEDVEEPLIVDELDHVEKESSQVCDVKDEDVDEDLTDPNKDPFTGFLTRCQRKLVFSDVQVLVLQYGHRSEVKGKPRKHSKVVVDDFDKQRSLVINSFKKIGANVESITIANDWDDGDTFEKVTATIVELSQFITKMHIANHDQKLFLVSFDLAGSFAHLVAKLFPCLFGMINFGFRTVLKGFKRGVAGDAICNTPCPSLFILGTHSAFSNVDHLKDFKKNFLMPVGSVIVGYADHRLRLPFPILAKMKITQSCVDRMIMEHVADFIDICCCTRDLMIPRVKVTRWEEMNEIDEKLQADGIKRQEEVLSEKEKEKLRKRTSLRLTADEKIKLKEVVGYIAESDKALGEHKIETRGVDGEEAGQTSNEYKITPSHVIIKQENLTESEDGDSTGSPFLDEEELNESEMDEEYDDLSDEMLETEDSEHSASDSDADELLDD